MPTLFDSHEEFNEWFSKDIESHAEKQSGIDAGKDIESHKKSGFDACKQIESHAEKQSNIDELYCKIKTSYLEKDYLIHFTYSS